MMKLKESTMRKTWVVCLLAMICCLLWGSAFPCIKVGYKLFQVDSTDTAAQILFAGCRFTLAGVLVILFGAVLQRTFLKPGRTAIAKIIKISLLQTVLQYFFFYVGLAHTTGVKGSIVEASNVFLSILVSSLLFRMEKLDAKKIIGCMIGFAGVVIINLSGNDVSMMCQHCQKHVHDALAAMDGVTAVTVDLEGKKADVTTSKDIPTEDFAKVIADAGYELVK